jgi:glycosyltransferase involved in cell wall biosynthesis
MNIVVAIDTYNDANGCTIATKRLVKELRERGHKVRILGALHEDPSDPDFFKIRGFVMPGAEEAQKNMEFLMGRNDYKIFEKAMEDADVVLVQFPFPMARGAIKTANRLGIPVIGSLHMQPQNMMAAIGKSGKMMERLIWFVFKFLLFNRVKVVHCPSTFAAELLSAQGVNAHLRPISNGIPTEYVPGEYERPQWFGDKMVLLNIGRHADEKRQSVLIEAVKRSKYKDNIQLILAGKGEMTEELKTKGKDLPVEPFIEYISQEDKLKYLNTADLYVHASYVDLESLSCLEAIGCGLPCLITDSKYSAASQFALDDRFIFKSEDAEQLALKIDYWYENRNDLKSAAMKEKVLKEAENYRFVKSVNEYEILLRETVASNNEDDEFVLEPGIAKVVTR